MHALSDAQYRAAVDGGVPGPEQVDPDIWSLAVPMPGGHLAYTLSVVALGHGGVTVVDPGWDTADGAARLDALLASLGRSIQDVEWIVVTHAHPDHLGAAHRLRQASGARLLMHEREQAGIDRERQDPDAAHTHAANWGVPTADAMRIAESAAASRAEFAPAAPADLLLRDGDRLPIPGLDWLVVSTPGHTDGHICVVDEDRRLLLTGDHVIPHVFPGVGLGAGGAAGTNPVADYLASLQRIAEWDGFDVLPGHGYRFQGLADRRAEMTAHIVRRAREVATRIDATPDATVWEVAARLSWSAGWEVLSQGPMLPSALLQTGYYLDFVRAGGLQEIPADGEVPRSRPSTSGYRAARS